MRRRGWMTQVLAVTLAWVFLVAESLAVAGTPQLPNPGSAPLSRDQQIQLGQKALGEVYQQMPVLPDSSPIVQYVQQLGRKLDTQIPQQYNWPYQFHVVQQKEINAFAIPGGPIFINVGTITSAANEAQLAGVIAHEMSHVYMQHSAKQMKQNLGPSIIAGLGQILGQMVGGIGGAIASAGGQMAGGLMSMKYSRGDEAQADAVGAIIMYKAGYDPKQMALFFQTLEKEGGPGGPQFLSDHPNPGNRYASITNEIRDWPAKNYTINSPAFTTAKQQAGGVKAYTAQEIANGAKSGQWQRENQQAGSIPKNVSMNTGNGQQPANGSAAGDGSLASVSYSQVRPSGNFKQENDQVLSIAYPDNWQVMPDSQGGGLTIAPQAGVSQGAVAYGVVIGGTSDTNVSLDSGTQSLLQDMEKSQGLRADGSPESITVNGAQARSLYLTGTSPVQQSGKAVAERDWLVTVERPQGGIIYAVFVAPQQEFSQLQPTYEHMLKTLHVK